MLDRLFLFPWSSQNSGEFCATFSVFQLSSPEIAAKVPSTIVHLQTVTLLPLARMRLPIPRTCIRSAIMEGMPRNMKPRVAFGNPSPSSSFSTTSSDRISLVSQHLNSTQTNPNPIQTQSRALSNMSSQPEHPALLIPGPIEFDDAVLQSMSHYRYDM